jgi:hypothetical protein
MTLVPIYFISKENSKTHKRSIENIEIFQSTAEFLNNKGIFNFLKEKKEEMSLIIDQEDEVDECTFVYLLNLNHHRKEFETYLYELLKGIKSEINPKMSKLEIDNLDRLLFDLYKIYFKLKDELVFEYFTLFEATLIKKVPNRPTKKAGAKKSPAKKGGAKKAGGKKSPAKKGSAKKAGGKKSPANNST